MKILVYFTVHRSPKSCFCLHRFDYFADGNLIVLMVKITMIFFVFTFDYHSNLVIANSVVAIFDTKTDMFLSQRIYRVCVCVCVGK